MYKTTKKLFNALYNGQLTPRMPVAFIGHGNPMNAINDSVFAAEWNKMAKLIPQPTAIICISAHWLTRGTYVTAMNNPKTIHDFYGFPQSLYEIEYTAPGSPELAQGVQSFTDHIETDHEWGLDHGAWTILMHMYPNANIPTIQLSIDMQSSIEQLNDLMRQLQPLRDRGVLFLGSGNIVHNLELVDFHSNTAADWAIEFDQKSKELIEKKDIESLINYSNLGSAARMAIPTEDHYRPMTMTLGLIEEHEKITFFTEDIDLGSVSMRSFISTST
jgi:4,5-DOPA dioxygenase extradiol